MQREVWAWIAIVVVLFAAFSMAVAALALPSAAAAVETGQTSRAPDKQCHDCVNHGRQNCGFNCNPFIPWH